MFMQTGLIKLSKASTMFPMIPLLSARYQLTKLLKPPRHVLKTNKIEILTFISLDVIVVLEY